ncbi:MAG TPA: M56 family metallopeptidase [Gemmataceae bacterium]|jgi:beta-lactamase regulating signal transducer with metallopeptidase domain|nr:M56 family metallopeptidase [Gemmataceae bacterium]
MDWLVHVGLVNAALAALLALAAAAVGCLYRRPALVHGLWLLVLLKLVTPPLLPVHIPWPAPPQPAPVAADDAVSDMELFVVPGGHVEPSGMTDMPDPPGDDLWQAEAAAALARAPSPPAEVEGDSPAPEAAADTPAPRPPPAAPLWDSWEQAVAAVWLTGSLAWWSLAALRIYAFRRSLRHARPAPAALERQVRRLAARLGLSRCPAVCLLPAVTSPLLWAVAGTPRLLLPAGLWQRLTDEQRETLLTHELAHLRRGDHWVRRLELVVMGLYWWHPVVWWARREIQEAEEQCCDAWVVWALPGAAHAYATALVETVAFLSLPQPALPLGASGVGHTHSLKRRLTMILKGTTPRALTWTALGALVACAATLLPLGPTWVLAQSAEPAAGEQPAPETAPAADLPAAGEAVADTAGPARSPGPAREAVASGPNVQDVEEAKDEVELLKAQLDGKRAELLEAEALLKKASRQMSRADELGKRGAISAEERDQLRTDVEVREARVRSKLAQIREAELRLRQASGRLSRLQGRGRHAAGAAEAPPLFRGARGPLAGPRPVIAGPELAPVDATSAAPAAEGAPSVRVGPSAAPRDAERRLRDLEKKLDRLLREVEALRREIRQQRNGDSPTPSGGTTPGPGTAEVPRTAPAEPPKPAAGSTPPRAPAPSTSPARP